MELGAELELVLEPAVKLRAEQSELEKVERVKKG